MAAIEAGRDFRKAIEEGVTKCGVLLVVIGPEWLEAKDERGARRLTDSSDFVRIETASALGRDRGEIHNRIQQRHGHVIPGRSLT